MLVCGPTMSGISTFVYALLNDKRMFSSPPKHVYWFYGAATPELKARKDFILHEGLLTLLNTFHIIVLLS